MKVRYKPMDKFKGEQFFSLNVDRPDLLPISNPKSNDIFFIAHNSLPPAIGVCGFLCPKSRFEKKVKTFVTDGEGIGFVLDGDSEVVVIDLAPRGIDFYFSIRFSVFESALPNEANRATSRLFSVDKKAHTFKTNELLGLWTPDHVNPIIPMFTLKQSPFANIRAPKLPERDLKKIVRGPDGVISEQLWNDNSE